MLAKIRNFLREEEGAETVEWVFVVALLIIGALVAWQALRDEIIRLLEDITGALEDVPSGS